MLAVSEWQASFRRAWRQGEHLLILGQTGAGKTTIAEHALRARDWVCVLALKRKDDTILHYGRDYTRIKDWPPDFGKQRVIYKIPPRDLGDLTPQASRVYDVLNRIYKAGGWCVFIDDAGYASGMLGQKKSMATLLSQARSSHISVGLATTQPGSIALQMPSEALRQIQHVLVFSYRNQTDVEGIARITGYDKSEINALMGELGPFDFLAFSHGNVVLVRNERRRR